MANTGSVTQLPPYYSSEELERAQVLGADWLVQPPRLMQANGKAFDRVANGVHRRVIQNMGVEPIYYWIGYNVAPNYGSDTPHGILPGCKVAGDGSGGQLDVSSYNSAVWLGNPTTGTFNALLFASYVPGFSANSGEII